MINYGFSIDLTGNALKGLQQLETLSKKIKGNFNDLNRSNINIGGNAANSFNSIGNSARNATSSIATLRNALLGIGALNVGKAIFEQGLFFEKAKISFEKLSETPEMGRKLYKDLTEFAKATPVTFDEAIKGGGVLLGAGLKSDELVSHLERVATVTKTVGADLNLVLYNYAQGFTKKAVDAIDIRQYATHLIPIRQVLTEMFKDTTQFKNLGGLDEMVRAGMIGSKAVVQAFKLMTEEGGRYQGMLKAIMETPAGKLSLLQSSAQLTGQKLFEKALPSINKFLDYLNKLLDQLPRLEGAFDKLVSKLDITDTWWYRMAASLLGFNNELGKSGDIIDKISGALDVLGSILSVYVKYIMPFQILSGVLGSISGILTVLTGVSGFAGLAAVISGAGAAAGGLLAAFKAMSFVIPVVAANAAAAFNLYKTVQGEGDSYKYAPLSGAVVGATIGSIIPGVGTAIGAVVGGSIGLAAGSGLGAYSYYKNKKKPESEALDIKGNNYDLLFGWKSNAEKTVQKEKINAEDLLQKGKEASESGGGAGGRTGIGGRVRDFIININAPIVKVDKIVSEDEGVTGTNIAKIAADQFGAFLTEVQLSTQ